jgi:NAD(P)-dependent dehydrogenase (short-subunit alcohol dehydrogenase family)
VPTALVVGASRGIGAEFVRQYVAEKWRVLATARDEKGLEKLHAAGATPLAYDVTAADADAALDCALEAERLDVALYVAGVYTTAGAAAAPSAAEFDRVMHTNVLGAMRVIPRIAPRVAAAGGKFVFITSGMGSIGGAEGSYGWLYRTSKAALNMAVHAAQFDYPKATMIVIDPGWVRTDMGGASAPLAVEDSVRGMRATIAKLGAKDRGKFFAYDGRQREW